ncbi:MAG TPA: hypothetical protein VMR34_03525 [Candidatus Saccharimonadales bacterium]|nr:hypothetical protein [Candidatus Saccharimonadales bacterium]
MVGETPKPEILHLVLDGQTRQTVEELANAEGKYPATVIEDSLALAKFMVETYRAGESIYTSEPGSEGIILGPKLHRVNFGGLLGLR